MDGTDTPARWWRQPLPWLLLLAALLRAFAAFQPGFHHPDAIYQYLEPAHRLLTGDGVVTWEWRVGMRSLLLPSLLVVPMAVGEALGPGGALPVAVPRLAMGLASLTIVWAAWRLGRRHSPGAGLLAGFVAATWFECIYFGVQTLAEPAAAAAFLPAAVLVTADRPALRHRALAGALLAFAVLMRPHYAPSALALVGVALWQGRPALAARDVGALAVGGLAVIAIGACVDLATGSLPFAWIVENIRQNIVAGVAARYGVSPPLHYVTLLLQIWGWWIVPIGIGLRFGWRVCPALLAAAAMTLVVHSLVGHKEYRFIYLAVVAVVMLSAIGWAEIGRLAAARWGERAGARAMVVIVVAWSAATLLLPSGYFARAQQERGVPGSMVFARLRGDPATCGVALLFGAHFADVPGTAALRPHTPLSLYWINDPAARQGPWQAIAQHRSDFNRIVGSLPRTGAIPVGYRTVMCSPATTVTGLCLYARPGGCTDTSASPFRINRAMTRLDF